MNKFYDAIQRSQVNLLRTASLYVQGATTLLFFYLDFRQGSSDDIGTISFLITLATAFDFGIYNRLIKDAKARISYSYSVSLAVNTLLAIVVLIWFNLKFAILFLVTASYPFWFLRFLASNVTILNYLIAHIVALISSYIFSLEVLEYFVLRGVLVYLFVSPPLVKHIRAHMKYEILNTKELVLPIVLTLVSNYGLFLTQFTSLAFDNKDFFYDKIALFGFVIFQFLIKLKETAKINVGKARWILMIVSVSLASNGFLIPARYVIDIYGSILIIELLQKNELERLLFSGISCLLVLSLITTYSSEVSVWLIQLIGSTLFVLILETKNSDNKYLFRANPGSNTSILK